MKKTIILITGLITFFLLFQGCPPVDEDVTIEERIDRFVDGLNDSDRSDLYTHFHPDTEQYSQMKASATFFETTPLAFDYAPFDITLTSSPDNEADGQQTVNAVLYRNDGDLVDNCVLVMEKDGASWYIRRFTLSSFVIFKSGIIE